MIGFRSYLEKATKTGPSYSEIVYDRAIKFDPKKLGKVKELEYTRLILIIRCTSNSCFLTSKLEYLK